MRPPWQIVPWAVTLTAAVVATLSVDQTHADPNLPWRAEFFETNAVTQPPFFTTRHSTIDFDWGRGAPLASWIADGFSVRWDACLRVDSRTRITFRLASDDGSRLYVNRERIIDHWREHGFRAARSRTVVLDPGPHHVRVDYFEATGPARIQLTTSSQPRAVEWLPLPGETAGSCDRHQRGPD